MFPNEKAIKQFKFTGPYQKATSYLAEVRWSSPGKNKSKFEHLVARLELADTGCKPEKARNGDPSS